ncbi:hypothetical protein PHISP_06779 [Aspergillus sp. HF37]|nr:hypothetical protein PHISP_06779 [Aspergillus sp. HF37]
MMTHNSYLSYKRDTSKLLAWIVRSSNSIIKSAVYIDDAPKTINTTGQVTVADIVTLSRLVAKHVIPVPSAIYRLFQSVIEARTSTYALFQQTVAKFPDAEIEKSNASHKHFIGSLNEAFECLGGVAWASRQDKEKEPDGNDDLEPAAFTNIFDALSLNESKDDGDSSETEAGQGAVTPPSPPTTQRRRQTRRSGKAKKGRRGNKAKKKQRKEADAEAQGEKSPLDDLPLESYRIVPDEDGIVAEYLMAVYALFELWAILRSYLQGVWQDVAYNGLNSAVAGTVSNIAISIIKRMELVVFVDFPGHDSYEAIMNTVTRGDPEKAQGMFSLDLHVPVASSSGFEKVQATSVDVLEQFSIHAYRDLLAFVTDFQKNRSGKPTTRMGSRLRSWDPHFNLQVARKEERINWRRSYTINWLYDLVNVFSSIVVSRNNIRGEKHIYEDVDWSLKGPWNVHRRLFGLNEFAGTVTSLAMQKQSTDIHHRILPHHVFQLQCIVDSLAVSRGWSLDGLKGHVLIPPADTFRARRDIDLFLDRDCKRSGTGYIQAASTLKSVLDQESMLYSDKERHQQYCQFLDSMREDFCNWLGETNYAYGLLETIPPSRFLNSNANGLWEFSPFLCGVGLMEALELAYSVSMSIWEGIPEPMMLTHLHNMLVQRGYITKPVNLFTCLQHLFPTAFFAGGKAPTSRFKDAFHARIFEAKTSHGTFRQRASAQEDARTADDVHALFDQKLNRFFRIQPQLGLYRCAEWNPDRIPDSDVPLASWLFSLRLGAAKFTIDRNTGEKRLEDTELIRRAKARGMSEQTLLEMWSAVREMTAANVDKEASMPFPPEGQSMLQPHRWASGSPHSGGLELSEHQLLALLKIDILQDVSGEIPISALNYLSATVQFKLLFSFIENELIELKNPTYVRAYTAGGSATAKKLALTTLALVEEDEECLTVMAKAFDKHRTNFTTHVYWEELDGMEYMKQKALRAANEGEQAHCMVM